jgi:hypothetical protein
MSPLRLSESAREDLGDARLLLESASHNLQALLRGAAAPADLEQALANARDQVKQVAATLDRVLKVKDA